MYQTKFGDQYKELAPEIPTLEELLTCCRENFPNIRLGVEIKSFTEETVDLTVALLKKYGYFDTCWFYAFSGKIIRYLKEKYDGRTMGYPDFLMQEFVPDDYNYYKELGISMRVAKSEISDHFVSSPLPKHFYCADTEEDVQFFLDLGADLITANNPVPLLKLLGKLPQNFEE
jgi:glycerophosphoryl diester phosphodiesterase